MIVALMVGVSLCWWAQLCREGRMKRLATVVTSSSDGASEPVTEVLSMVEVGGF
jgi:hypothetical protein